MGERVTTTDLLITTAERLIAQHGVAGVSLRQIAAEAGQRNSGVIQYHFGDLDTLLDAIISRRVPQVNRRRQEILDEVDAAGRGNELRGMVEAIVRPYAEVAVDSPYLGFLARLHEHVGGFQNLVVSDERWASSTHAIVARIHTIVDHVPAATLGRRILSAYGFAIQALGMRGREVSIGSVPSTDELVDMLTGAIGAPHTAHDHV